MNPFKYVFNNPFKFLLILLTLMMSFVVLVLITSGEYKPEVREANLARQAKEAVSPKVPVLTQAEKNQAVFDSIADGTYVDTEPSLGEPAIWKEQTIWDSFKFLGLWGIGMLLLALCTAYYWWGDDDGPMFEMLKSISRKLDK
jgi:hypothetical protein